MNLNALEDGYLLRVDLDQARVCLELRVLTESGSELKVVAFNRQGLPVSVAFGAMSLGATHSTSTGIPCLGAIDSAAETAAGVCIEGDFGDITFSAATVEVHQSSSGLEP